MPRNKRKVAAVEHGVDTVESLEPQAKRLLTTISHLVAGPEKKFPLSVFRGLLNSNGYSVHEKTLSTWRKNYPTNPHYFSHAKSTGRPRALGHDDELLLGGFIMHRFRQNITTTFGHVTAFLEDELNISVSASTTIAYVHTGGFSKQVGLDRGKTNALISHHQMLALGLEFIEKLKAAKFYEAPSHRVFCIDVTLTSHRHDDKHTLAPRGTYVHGKF